MDHLNSLIHAVLFALLALSGTTVLFLVILLAARLRKKDPSGLKTVATWTGIATSVGSFAIAALNVTLPIGVLQSSDPAYEAIRNFYAAIQTKQCSNAWALIHDARKTELKDKDFGEPEFCKSYGTTQTYSNLEIQRQDTKNEAVAARRYRVAYDV
jgi:hypothetical protein